MRGRFASASRPLVMSSTENSYPFFRFLQSPHCSLSPKFAELIAGALSPQRSLRQRHLAQNTGCAISINEWGMPAARHGSHTAAHETFAALYRALASLRGTFAALREVFAVLRRAFVTLPRRLLPTRGAFAALRGI